ncbi:MAG: acetate--CoA ligase family protein [Desulforhopalus sp.]
MQTHIDFTGISKLLNEASKSGRNFLFEHEVYDFIRLIGSETPPEFYFVKKEERLDPEILEKIPGDQVVVKIVSPFILHKSDVGGVQICGNTSNSVLSTIRRMSIEIPEKLAANVLHDPDHAPKPYQVLAEEVLLESISNDIEGYIICQYMGPDSEEFGNELLVSLRNTREFGMILSAGLGGRDTELYAKRFRKGQAVVSASCEQVKGIDFLALFKETISYRKLAGLTRGQKRIVTDSQLLECFEAFIEVGRFFSPSNTLSQYTIEELEINPFAFSNFLMMPLDGLCSFTTEKKSLPQRPIQKIDKMLHPNSIAIVGISSQKINIGRIILHNILAGGFPKEKITLIHPKANLIDDIPTIPQLSSMPQGVDLLILAVDGGQLPELMDLVQQHSLAESVILISGALGDSPDQTELTARVQEKIISARQRSSQAPIFLGVNSLGVLSHPGQYDAMFIPESKLPKNRGSHRRNSGFVSQSGAYMITRMSKLPFLDPAYAVSIGNQIDLTAGDFLHFLNQVSDLKTVAFYMEGFSDLDGLNFCRAIRAAIPRGKEVIFYKAGRTPEGKDALSGHTASIAGDYMVCDSCISQAGAIVAETFNEFEGLLMLSCTLEGKTFNGCRLASVSNAGYEAVGIADNLLGEDYRLDLAGFTQTTHTKLAEILTLAGLDNLTGVNNPMDLTPMASEDVYIQVLETLLADDSTDAIIMAVVPLSPILHTLPEEIHSTNELDGEANLIERVARLNNRSKKPLVMVIDSGKLYDPLAEGFQSAGLPVFRSADIAVRVLGKYLHCRGRNSLSMAEYVELTPHRAL